VAEQVEAGKIVARFAGRMEYGPRALCNRSILYKADDPSVNTWLNHRLKRTEFMPFAPVLLREDAPRFLLGYQAVRRTSVDPVVRGKRSAIIGLLLLPNVIIVNRSVEWWRSLHQEPTLLRLDPTIEGLQLFTLMFSMAVVGVMFVWFTVHRFRLAWLQDQVDKRWLADAIDERRSEVVA